MAGPVEVQNLVTNLLTMQLAADAPLEALVARPNIAAGYDGFYKQVIPPPPGGSAFPREAMYPAVVTIYQTGHYEYALTGDPVMSVCGFNLVYMFWAVGLGREANPLEPMVNRMWEALHALNSGPTIIETFIVEEPRLENQVDGSGRNYVYSGGRCRVKGHPPA